KRIDLCQYAVSRGFVLDRKQSSRSSAVLRHPNGDKLIVARNANGQYVYFNAKGSDNGTIIDLIQSRDRISLGEVRKLLRPWLGRSAASLPDSPPPTLPLELQPSEHDAARVLARWMQARPIGQTHPYLEAGRHIPRAVLKSPLFQDRIRIDARGNALFPHFNLSGLCGFEIKNTGWTGFSPGGVKGLAGSRPQPDDRELVIGETVIDLLSYATLKGTAQRRFLSTAGQISPSQSECLRIAAGRMPPGSRIVLAVDHDDGGWKLATQIRAALAASGLPIVEDIPPQPGDDWNDVLRRGNKPADRIPASP
ncbi:MAG: DUF3991 domain-containing protein, partial [Planctomycetaceae bacterium]